VKLLTETIGQGPVRRCDGRCYNGKNKTCVCICGGRNHGVGLEQALKNVQEIFQPMLAAFDTEHQPFLITRVAERRLRRDALPEAMRKYVR
jgi:hypothetical protein